MKRILVFLSLVVVLTAGLSAQRTRMLSFPEPPRAKGQTNVLQLACAPIDTVRMAFIGLGMRGSDSFTRYMYIDGVKVVALCDLLPERVDSCQKVLRDHNRAPAAAYSGVDGWKRLCERNDIDLVYICTPWVLHTPIAVYAMQNGKHVAMEVPAAMTLDECWQLVKTAEKTRRQRCKMRHAGAQPAFHCGHQMLHLRVPFQPDKFGNTHRAVFANAPQVVAQKVGDHYQFCVLFGVRLDLDGEFHKGSQI